LLVALRQRLPLEMLAAQLHEVAQSVGVRSQGAQFQDGPQAI
jgi:hypothetical protein